MKHLKHLLTVALTMLVALAVAVPAFAADPVPHSITVTNENTSITIVGRTYNAYKLFDSTHNGDAYAYTLKTSNQFYDATLVEGTPTAGSLAETLKTYFDFTAVAGDNTKVNVAPKANFDARAFADDIQKFLTGKTADATEEATAETVTLTLPSDEAGEGYYIVTGDVKSATTDEVVVSAVILTNTDPTAEVSPKASIPTLDKKITGQHTLDAAGKAAVAEVGKVVSYELDSVVPDLRGYSTYTFTFNDEITDGLDYNRDSFALTINGASENIPPVFAADGKSFSLTIPMATLAKAAYKAGDPIVLTYTATVNENSLNYDFEKNTATLTYSNNPYDSESSTPTPPKETYVVNVNVDVYKFTGAITAEERISADEYAALDDEAKAAYTRDDATGEYVKAASNGTPLKDAKFKLYKGATKPADTAEAWYKYDATNKKVTWVAKADAEEIKTDSTGALETVFQGLEAEATGTAYGLVETEAPTGYNLLANPIPFTLTATYNATNNQVTVATTAGTVDHGTINLGSQTQNPAEVTQNVLNESGTVLPSTGGIGTTIFYVVGGALVITAGVLLVTKRRMASLEK